MKRDIMSSAVAYRTQKYTFHKGWVWPHDIDQWFERELGNLLDMAPRPIVHICNGSSRLGEILIDSITNADIRADALNLPLKDESVGTIISDPPWDWDLNLRNKAFFEMARVHQEHGLLLWCAPWLPMEGLWTIQKVIVASPRVGMPRNARLLVRAKRRHPDITKKKSSA